MSKTLLIDTAPIPKNPTTSHTRTALIISNELGIDLISKVEDLKLIKRENYSKFAIIGSAFYDKTAEIEKFIRDGVIEKIYWINNEHTCSPNSEYAKLIKHYNSEIISNVVEQGNKAKHYNKFTLLNLNCLLMQEKNKSIYKKYKMLYYGTYRAGRRIYIQKYFSENDEFILSSKTKNLRKFKQLAGCNCLFADSPVWNKEQESFNLVEYTIYLEDEMMHKNFNHLSNRFYEAIFCNVVQFFDKSCLNTIKEHSLYNVDDFFIVDSKRELIDKMNSKQYTEMIQMQDWEQIALNEKKTVLTQLKSILL